MTVNDNNKPTGKFDIFNKLKHIIVVLLSGIDTHLRGYNIKIKMRIKI